MGTHTHTHSVVKKIWICTCSHQALNKTSPATIKILLLSTEKNKEDLIFFLNENESTKANKTYPTTTNCLLFFLQNMVLTKS